MVFRADQEDARRMPRPDGYLAREECQADAMQQASVAPVLRMKIQLLFSQIAFLTSALHVEKVRVNLQKKKISHLGCKNCKKKKRLLLMGV
jgi:hypothetical protein